MTPAERRELLREYAEMRAREVARRILETVMRVDVSVVPHDDHPTIPDPDDWSLP